VKKLLSVLLVAAMVLGLMGTAFAANDVTGTKYAAAVSRLNALSILKGYEDGSFKPNNNITRAEFAAVAVRALGLEAAAKGTIGGTKFADVPATHWAAGYINVAVGYGVIKGYPDNTFKPEAPVTNAEAIAMLVRVLGYEPAVVGEWPMNYISKASEIGLTTGLSFATDLPALRGDVALLTNAALTIDMMVQVGYGTLQTYAIVDQTLMANKLGMTEITGQVTSAPLYDRVGLKANEVVITNDEGTETYTFDAALNFNALIGHSVLAYAKDGNIVFVTDKTNAANVVTFTVHGYTATELVKKATPADVAYDFSDTDVVFFNHAAGTVTDITDAFDAGETVTVTLVVNSDKEILAVDATRWDNTVVVTSVTTGASGHIDYKAATTGTTALLDLNEDAIFTITDATGAVKTLADVAKNDVLSYGTNGAELFIRIVRNAVTGTVTKTTTADDTDITAYKVYVGTTGYSVATGAGMYDGTDYDAIDNTNVDSLVGSTGTFLLDAAGKIFYANVAAATPDQNLAFVASATWDVASIDGTTTYVKITKLDGTKTTIAIDTEDVVPGIGTLVEYTLDDGVIDTIAAFGADETGVATFDAKYDRVSVAMAGTYVITANTKVFNGLTAGAVPKAITWATIENVDGLTVDVYLNADYANRADMIVVTAGTIENAVETAVIMKSVYNVNTSTGAVKHLVVDEDGVEKDYVVGTLAVGSDTFAPNVLAYLTFDGAGKVTGIEKLVAADGAYTVTSDDDLVAGIVDGYFKVSTTVVYDATDDVPVKVDWASVGVDCVIDIFSTDGVNIDYVVITDK
jgi:hypothetical protein